MAGTSSIIYSAEVGTRSSGTPGDIQTDDAMPDVSGVTFYAFPCEGAVDSAGGGSSSVSSADYGLDIAGRTTARPTSFINRTGSALYGAADNERIDHMQVDGVTMTARFVEYGAASIIAQPEHVMLGSSMGYRAPSTVKIDATGAGSDFGNIPVADTSAYDLVEGDMLVRHYSGGRVTYHQIVNITAGTPGSYDVHPWMESATGAEKLGVAAQYYAVTGNSNTALDDFHLRVSAGGRTTDAEFGRLFPMCRLGGLNLSADGDALNGEWTVSTVVGLDNDASASVVSTSERDGSVLNGALNATITIGPDVRGQTAPYGAAPTYTLAERFSFDAAMTWDIASGPTNGFNVAGTTDRDIIGADCVVNMSVEAKDSGIGQTMKRMLAKQEQRHFSIVFGPGYNPDDDDPSGACLFGVFARTEDDSAVSGNDQSKLARGVTLAAVGDAANIVDASTALAVAPFRLCFPIG